MSEWSGKSYGGYWGNWCFVKLLNFGLLPAYGLLVFVAAFFAVFRRRAMRGGEECVRRVCGSCGFLRRYKLAFSFGVLLLDRAAFFAGNRRIKCVDGCRKEFQKLLGQNRGLIVVASHTGGWQIAGAHLETYGREVYVMGVDSEDSKIAELIDSKRVKAKAEVAQSSGGGSLGILPAYAALKRGAIVALHADRYMGGRGAKASFLGGDVMIPETAWALAAKSGAPVVQIACVRSAAFNYKMFFFEPAKLQKSTGTELDAALAAQACRFASNLENIVREHPYQWCNFYDFWGDYS